MYKQFKTKIEEFSRIIIHRHNKPDGDALGSQLGLKEAIMATFGKKEVFVVGDISNRYAWMGNMDEIDDEMYEGSLVIILDCGASYLISDERYTKGKYIIKVDHHLPQGNYGDLEIVDTTFESCAGLLADILIKNNFLINEKSAAQLFTGIVTDSGRFRYSSTTPRTFNIASLLLEKGINQEELYSKLYAEKLELIKFRASLISKFQTVEPGVAYLINSRDDVKRYMDQYNVTVFDISRGMVNIMSGIIGIDIWTNITEDLNNDIYVEIRSNGININQIATKYGGGGHLHASGCTLKNSDQVEELLKDLIELGRKEICLI